MIKRFEYKVLDNLVPPGMANWIESRVVHHGLWVYNDVTSEVDGNFDPNDKNILETPQYTNSYFDADDGGPRHQLFGEIAQPIMWFLEKETGLQIEKIARIKANLLNPFPGVEENNYHIPHIDHGGEDCLSLVYYITESDGDTRIFDKYVSEGHNDLTMIHSNTPKRGSALLFQSHRFHSSSNPIKTKARSILNFVVVPTTESYAEFLKNN
jgi:hypothetical protein